MNVEIIGPKELRGYIRRGETYQWVLIRDSDNLDVSGHLAFSHKLGFYIPCGIGLEKEMFIFEDGNMLIYNNNERSESFIFRDPDGNYES